MRADRVAVSVATLGEAIHRQRSVANSLLPSCAGDCDCSQWAEAIVGDVKSQGWSAEQRDTILRKLRDTSVDVDGCRVWIGSTSKWGYGQIGIDHRIYYAHRLAYELFVGPIADGDVICHRCDNPPCWLPEHLFAAPQSENLRDMREKGRWTPPMAKLGSDHHNAKLNEEAVRTIRKAHTGGVSTRALATQFNVAGSTIKNVLSRRTWSHVQ